MTDYLLDTSAAIARINQDRAFIDLMSQVSGSLYLSSIALGELYFGAENSGRVQQNLQTLKEFSRNISILECDADTALIYGNLRFKLKKKGRPVNSDNDIWIAAIALQHNLTLITRDSDFQAVDGLTVVGW